MATSRSRHAIRALLAAAYAWTVANAAYVYFGLGGDRFFRLETAIYILIAVSAPIVLAGKQWSSDRPDLKASTVVSLSLASGAVWIALAWPLAGFPLLSEDYGFRARYVDLASGVSTGQFFRPLFGWLFAILDRVGSRSSPVPFHVASAALHVTAAALTGRLCWQFTHRRDAALVAATLFLLNPAQPEATLWISGLQEQLWATALLGALVVYAAEPLLTGSKVIVAGGLIVTALLSKETAVAAALILPALDGIVFRWRRGPWMWRGYGALAALLVAYGAVRSQFVTIESTFLVVPSQYFVKQLVSLPFKTLAQPWNAETLQAPLWFAFATSLVAITCLTAAIWRARVDRRLLLGPVLVLGSVLPVYSYFFVDANLMASRYIYFAAAGWAILMAELLARTMPSRPMMIAAVLAVVAFSTVLLHVNLRSWKAVGTMVADMDVRIRSREAPEAVVSRWHERLGHELKIRDGVPRSYRGVWVFENGWQEFLEQRNSEF